MCGLNSINKEAIERRKTRAKPDNSELTIKESVSHDNKSSAVRAFKDNKAIADMEAQSIQDYCEALFDD